MSLTNVSKSYVGQKNFISALCYALLNFIKTLNPESSLNDSSVIIKQKGAKLIKCPNRAYFFVTYLHKEFTAKFLSSSLQVD